MAHPYTGGTDYGANCSLLVTIHTHTHINTSASAFLDVDSLQGCFL